MMSMRTIARSAPRTLTRLSSAALRQSVARPSILLKSTLAPLRSSQLTSSFSTTQFRRAPAGEVDEELSVKLESELQFEGEMKENEQLPASVKDFLENSPFELIDTPGKEDVILKRKFGNETITVSFSISDLANYEPDMFNEDNALADEELEGPEARTAEAEAEEGLEGEEDADAAVPCRLNVVVEKDGKGALNIEAVAQDGQILVENFYYYKDAKLAHGESAEISHQAQDTYPGPPFGSLDEDLQMLMERYLEERGVTQAMAVFVPDYMDTKEQKEYQTWLKDVKQFIDA
ncbi:mitochondrial glyco protein [Pseudomassariella vexata]|uniref:Mitochondrial glyco protein n=1 Tax=Pseudomassariella vexata TaxID=1141098 RepID=A0A1Y2DI92_9PEZI|nr:mitochondrial glyco protein [Pseudomassariella vexata]ORY58866.1 mitochondrial glyco protein [Pseudomassariella vexata]